ncbi:type II toxin-antitoxin system RelE/ParE family toxin [Photorhabdus antumapuensis]|uniref:type II toxin-antitoxin system RelE/ParE family toxin n=1 Tax=Photorhabdus antumapuensis TaxID=2862867 RepID=UPI001CEE003E|nr:type II toxin-antitoxin system RelE/ParE family toxin [Photorhabdus antumapuensis]MCA6221239.1 type II toxin-antitoxin system RelE/ParE family toxin [Photorhabdus antumapuensis]
MKYPPAQKKSMRKTIGRYAMQLTIKSADSYRMIYVAKFEEAIYVLHPFKKRLIHNIMVFNLF